MPSADEILKGLTLLSNKYLEIAIAWHTLILVLFFFYFFTKGKLTNQFVTLILCLPLLSVSVFAWLGGNPFNGVLFLAAGVLLFLLGNKRKEFATFVEAKPWSQITGTLIFLSGLFYPHFLEGSWWSYLYGAPVGLIPCPTLLLISGLYLLLPIRQSRSWILTMILLDAFYGLFGVFKLQVYLDAILIAATIILILHPGIIKKPKRGATIQTLPSANRA